MQNRLTLGLKEAAAAVGLSPWTLRGWIRQGKLRSVRLGRRVMVEPAELKRLVEQGRCGAEDQI
jgi:excisionase family DNA binding protein